jgi:hypothetical protein
VLTLAAATTLGTYVFASADGNSTLGEVAVVLNTFLLIVLNILANRNKKNIKQLDTKLDETQGGVGETVQRTQYIDQNGDEHIVIHRYHNKGN